MNVKYQRDGSGSGTGDVEGLGVGPREGVVATQNRNKRVTTNITKTAKTTTGADGKKEISRSY